ncbi:MAG: precorrin-2 C(20)-methyltransferase [Deltaproteobacteria bacterium]|nr:precorrin-2 C(20)-methyltransferase [Deltaproteobacteria bacterium]MBW2069555.1 precorrin-2 C(20)-methyltransferase [Deltaproteobacteria bacterium]
MTGILYGIGVGPGDPGLITVKAVEILKKVPFVFAAASSKNSYSVALDIVRKYLPSDTVVECLSFPMTYDENHLQSAWRANGERVADVIARGNDAAFVTLGDPLMYSTYIYLVKEVRKILPQVQVETVPGITSFQAAASACNLPLVEGEESLAVVSGAQGSRNLKKMLQICENVVLMKVYKHIDEIIDTICDMRLETSTYFITRCGLQGQEIRSDIRSLKGSRVNYLSLMIVKSDVKSY